MLILICSIAPNKIMTVYLCNMKIVVGTNTLFAGLNSKNGFSFKVLAQSYCANHASKTINISALKHNQELLKLGSSNICWFAQHQRVYFL